jgi:hypothetical protein
LQERLPFLRGLGTSLMMLGRRAVYLLSAVGYSGMAAFAVSLAFGLACGGRSLLRTALCEVSGKSGRKPSSAGNSPENST